MTTPTEPDKAFLLATYQVERAADTAQVQRTLAILSLALVYMGTVSALVYRHDQVPIALLLLLPLPAMALLNTLIISVLDGLAHVFYIQRLEREITGERGANSMEAPQYQFPYWQRYAERIWDPQRAIAPLKPLTTLSSLMPLAIFIAFISALVVAAFQRAGDFMAYTLCAIAATSYLGMLTLAIATFWRASRTLATDFRS
jgi:hypothetical protein